MSAAMSPPIVASQAQRNWAFWHVFGDVKNANAATTANDRDSEKWA
jgi:hypothetical protein